MTNIEKSAPARVRHSCFVFDSSLVIRHSSFAARQAFTMVELLVVITIIVILAGLILATTGYVQNKGNRSRAESEIAAMSAALEGYKADNGTYPTSTATNGLNARGAGDPTQSTYQAASLYLYEQLSGDTSGNRQPSGTSYFAFRPNMLLPAPPSTNPVTAIKDPFGNSYGYSTVANPVANPGGASGAGYNPTYDLWSTAGLTAPPPNSGTDTITPQWVKNW